MKKVILCKLLGIIFISYTFGQTIDSVILKSSSGSVIQKTDTIIKSYLNGRLIKKYETNPKPHLPSTFVFYSYGADSLLVSELHCDGDIGSTINELRKNYMYSYVYNSDKELQFEKFYHLRDNDTVLFKVTQYNYSHLRTTQIIKTLQGGTLENFLKKEETFNAQGKIIESTYYKWNKEKCIWDFSVSQHRKVFKYDANLNLINMFVYEWDFENLKWSLIVDIAYQYKNGLLLKELQKKLNGEYLVSTVYSYYPDGRLKRLNKPNLYSTEYRYIP